MSFIIGTTITADPRTGLAAAKTLDGHVDFALVPDAFDGIDALEFSSWLGPITSELGLIPEVRVTHTEPFHVATASATLDYTARSRSGLSIGISTSDADAALFGRRPGADSAPAWAEAAQIIDLVRRLWDSWDDDAIIRDLSTDRYIERDRLHIVDAQLRDSAGTDYSVLGPSITPRPPQGHPPIVVRADADNAAAVESADIVLADIGAGDTADVDSAGPSVEKLRELVGPRTPVLARLAAPTSRSEVARTTDFALDLQSRGASGIVFSALPEEQLEFSIRLVSEIVPALTAAGLRTPAMSGADLRTRLGLPAAHSLYTHA
ncbi:LLM class flavin-dependent oxidoreductase [Brevibacterium sp. RIT 803]|uniref:LLM class flavin-dependent oxidoreductase n=1 Tax=Brevibacterium sp. RIT 803 TaxID=2810210 RepID=UPI001951C76B|nr:LLM class flavin-dependent oxidoreductase [Brevibacterium sp. RIT 803]MBM6589624.1 LLM class flavin-dependent oxidoreductase [Brevibacterium sp. RIT 803]